MSSVGLTYTTCLARLAILKLAYKGVDKSITGMRIVCLVL